MSGIAFMIQRVRADIHGLVQGVGFRPFVFHLARQMGLNGFVRNTSSGVVVEAEGERPKLDEFLDRIKSEAPKPAAVHGLKFLYLDPVPYSGFRIESSESNPDISAHILPDIAVCPECLKELFDSGDRRFRYPFINCTHCGPRFSITEALPYDRINTSMRHFIMCDECGREYDDPSSRRFHSQPNACPRCGPFVEWLGSDGKFLADHDKAVEAAVNAVRAGSIVAIKGLGGFHLIADARNEKAVRELRSRKHREEKPFAVMFSSLTELKEYCSVSAVEQRLLLSHEAPIVLVDKGRFPLAVSVAPGNPSLGAMLPYTPLHHLLIHDLKFPVVATSGNLTDEPICTDGPEAVKRLLGIADFFLTHNRPIVRPVDDSVARVIAGRPMMIRRARGYAPCSVSLKTDLPPLVALGGQLKNSVAFTSKNQVFLSQHIGDLENRKAARVFQKTIESFRDIYQFDIKTAACDRHPDYFSTLYAKEFFAEDAFSVQHHHAHIVACMAENHLDETVLGIAWDGTGWGDDSTIWGGEFFAATLDGFERAGHLRTFTLPGGEAAVKEPGRCSFSVLWEMFGEDLLQFHDLPWFKVLRAEEMKCFPKMIERGINSPRTSSMGRLFDAFAGLLGVAGKISFEGQAAMAVEHLLTGQAIEEEYPFGVQPYPAVDGNGQPRQVFILDWGPMIRGVIRDLRTGEKRSVISFKFHNTLAEMSVTMAKKCGFEKVVLSGGCFQNKYLTERVILRLKEDGFHPYWHQTVPPNDGGIALGQAVAAGRARAVYHLNPEARRSSCVWPFPEKF